MTILVKKITLSPECGRIFLAFAQQPARLVIVLVLKCKVDKLVLKAEWLFFEAEINCLRKFLWIYYN